MLSTVAVTNVASRATCRRAPASPCAWAASNLLQRPLYAKPASSPASHAVRFFFIRRQTSPVGTQRQQGRGVTTVEKSAKTQRKSGGRRPFLALVLLGIGAGTGYYFFSPANSFTSTCPASKEHPAATAKKAPKEVDYLAVYKAVAELLEDNDYDDGSYGPVFVRLAWHASGTFSKLDGTGGSNGATMRFAPESEHEANAGLSVARERLEQIKKKFPEISYGDLWTLAGVCAIQEMGGPTIKWSPGRIDVEDRSFCPPDGRLPDAAKKQDHIRDIFYRMGFNDQEIVALIGAHAIGRCHTDRSGFEGPWTPSPTMFTNDFFVQLLDKTWVPKKWNGPKQLVDKQTGELMMLPADYALLEDKAFRKVVEQYAKDSEKFFEDFAAAYGKLLHLGVKSCQKPYSFPVVNA